jgi:hypothetical protein
MSINLNIMISLFVEATADCPSSPRQARKVYPELSPFSSQWALCPDESMLAYGNRRWRGADTRFALP